MPVAIYMAPIALDAEKSFQMTWLFLRLFCRETEASPTPTLSAELLPNPLLSILQRQNPQKRCWALKCCFSVVQLILTACWAWYQCWAWPGPFCSFLKASELQGIGLGKV